MAVNKKIEPLSLYKKLRRSYNKKEFIAEVQNLLNSNNNYIDFILIAAGPDISSIRFGSKEPEDLRLGDVLFMLEKSKHDIMNIFLEEE